MVAKMGIPGSVGSAHLPPTVATCRVRTEPRVFHSPAPSELTVSWTLGRPGLQSQCQGGRWCHWHGLVVNRRRCGAAKLPRQAGGELSRARAGCRVPSGSLSCAALSLLVFIKPGALHTRKPSWASELEQMGMGRTSRQCQEAERRVSQVPREGCSRGAGGGEGRRGAAGKEGKDEACVQAALGTEGYPGMQLAAFPNDTSAAPERNCRMGSSQRSTPVVGPLGPDQRGETWRRADHGGLGSWRYSWLLSRSLLPPWQVP